MYQRGENAYGVVQIGLEVKFYKYERPTLTVLSRKLHLVQDVHRAIAWFNHCEANPLPVDSKPVWCLFVHHSAMIVSKPNLLFHRTPRSSIAMAFLSFQVPVPAPP